MQIPTGSAPPMTSSGAARTQPKLSKHDKKGLEKEQAVSNKLEKKLSKQAGKEQKALEKAAQKAAKQAAKEERLMQKLAFTAQSVMSGSMANKDAEPASSNAQLERSTTRTSPDMDIKAPSEIEMSNTFPSEEDVSSLSLDMSRWYALSLQKLLQQNSLIEKLKSGPELSVSLLQTDSQQVEKAYKVPTSEMNTISEIDGSY